MNRKQVTPYFKTFKDAIVSGLADSTFDVLEYILVSRPCLLSACWALHILKKSVNTPHC